MHNPGVFVFVTVPGVDGHRLRVFVLVGIVFVRIVVMLTMRVGAVVVVGFGEVAGLAVVMSMLAISVRMGVAMAGQAPGEEADPGQNQNRADDVSLLGVDLMLEAETDDGHHPREGK